MRTVLVEQHLWKRGDRRHLRRHRAHATKRGDLVGHAAKVDRDDEVVVRALERRQSIELPRDIVDDAVADRSRLLRIGDGKAKLNEMRPPDLRAGKGRVE